MIRALPHILARVFGPPLLIAPAKLDKMLLGLHAAMLQRGSALPEIEAKTGDDPAPAVIVARGYRIERGVATVPVHGVLVRRAGQITPDSTELQSYENVGRVLRNARSDSRVRGILLDIDSPGGEAGGIFDLAAEIRSTRDQKPVWAIAQDDALSAAYLLASAADRVWVTQTGAVGSIGVVALHADQSAFDAAEGIKYTYLFRGAHKIDANPHESLSGEARGVIQSEVDRLYTMLIDQVGRQRGIEAADVRKTEAGIYFGEHALSVGLADKIGTIDEAHAALATHVQGGPTMTQPTPPAAEAPEKPAPLASPPATDNNVVQLRIDEAAKAARAEAQSHAREIAELCALARYPELAAGFIGEGLTAAVVRERLQAKQATDSNKRPLTAIDPSDSRRIGRATGGPTEGELEAAGMARFRAMRGIK
jgi:signal peptide peptidase SppA